MGSYIKCCSLLPFAVALFSSDPPVVCLFLWFFPWRQSVCSEITMSGQDCKVLFVHAVTGPEDWMLRILSSNCLQSDKLYIWNILIKWRCILIPFDEEEEWMREKTNSLGKYSNNPVYYIICLVIVYNMPVCEGKMAICSQVGSLFPFPFSILSFWANLDFSFWCLSFCWGEMMLKKHKWGGHTTSLCLFDDARWPLCLFKVLSKFLERVEFPTDAK